MAHGRKNPQRHPRWHRYAMRAPSGAGTPHERGVSLRSTTSLHAAMAPPSGFVRNLLQPASSLLQAKFNAGQPHENAHGACNTQGKTGPLVPCAADGVQLPRLLSLLCGKRIRPTSNSLAPQETSHTNVKVLFSDPAAVPREDPQWIPMPTSRKCPPIIHPE